MIHTIMKTRICKAWAIIMALFAFASCSEDTTYEDTDLGGVTALHQPSEAYSLDLIDNNNAHLYFEWASSSVGTPSYSVIFSDSHHQEIQRIPSDDNGLKNSLLLSHEKLNEIARIAGILVGESGDIYWNVASCRLGQEYISKEMERKLNVKRYATTSAPYSLYLCGEGAECGALLENALKMKEIKKGVFEIYTKIDGPIFFTNRAENGNHRRFGANEGVLQEGESAIMNAEPGIYHIVVDFNLSTVALGRIQHVKYHWCWSPDANAEMKYIGNGCWERDICWNESDNRYRFDVVIDGKEYIWGYAEANMSETPDSWEGPQNNITVRPSEGINQWDYAFKHPNALRGIPCTIVIDMSATEKEYKHFYKFGFETTAKPVARLIHPSDGETIVLNGQAGNTIHFSWARPMEESMNTQLTSYNVVFFDKENPTEIILRKDAGRNDHLDIRHSELDDIADALGIAPEATGEILWGVESSLMGTTALSCSQIFNVTRIKGMPNVIYITGEASEFGDGYQAFKSLNTGKFEIFTHLSKGEYSITDGKDEQARRFDTSDGQVKECASSLVSQQDAIYYIYIDFVEGVSRYQKIENMRYVSPNVKNQNTEKQIRIPYQGNGIWYTEHVVPYLRDWDDDRYFFWAEVDGEKTKFGANPSMSGDVYEKPAENDERYRIFWPIPDVEGDDAGAFKMIHDYRGNDSKEVNIKLNMSPDTKHYYNYIMYLN